MTGTPKEIDLASYRLKVTGRVDRPLSLSFDDLRCMQKVTATCTLICPGFFEDHGTWAGVPITDVLKLAGLHADAVFIRLKGADDYSAEISLSALQSGDNFLAYEWEGELLPILHGFPVRAVFSEQEGNRWVKWLLEIEVQ